MKHIFIVNPAAGQINPVDEISAKLEKYKNKIDYTIYETEAPGDAKQYISNCCIKNSGEDVCFYACGGDGTINEVVNGIVGFDNALMSVYPCGSGNDFVKYYGGMDAFLDTDKLLNGREHKIDLIKVADRYSINIVNFGFDTFVAKTMSEVKKKPIIGGKRAYTTGVVKALFTAMKNKCTVKVDGEAINDGNILLCTVGNAQYVGGSYRCAPKALIDDGLLEICLIKPVSRFTFLRLIKSYKEGTHLENPSFKDCMVYRRSKSLEVIAPEGFCVTIDGEVIKNNHFTAEVVPDAIRFFVPKGAKPIILPEKQPALTR